MERPRAVIGLAASCILLALRHIGPLSEPPSDGSSSGGGGGGNGGGNTTRVKHGPLDVDRSAIAAGGAFVEVLGRALDPRLSEHLGSAALTTVMSAVLHCWPPPPSACGDTGGSAGASPPSVPGAAIAAAVEAEYHRGYAMGWWRLEPDGRLRNADDVAGAGVDETAAGAAQPEQQGEGLEDEFGSMDFLFSPELDAMLGGSTPSQSSAQQQAAGAAQAEAVAAEAAAVEAAAIVKEREKIWQSLAVGARAHILPHLNEISRTYTAARYAQGSSSSSSAAAVATAAAAAAAAAAAETVAVASRAAPSVPHPGAEGRGSAPALASSSVSATGGSSSSSAADFSRVGAGTMLELHASAVLVDLHGSGSGGDRSFGSGGRSTSGSGGDRSFGSGGRITSGGGRGVVGRGIPGCGYNDACVRYLGIHRMKDSHLVPQQRLLAPAFFCLVMGDGGDIGVSASGTATTRNDHQHHHSISSSSSSSLGGGQSSASPRPAPPWLEILRGREWEVLHLWMQAALDPLAFPRGHRRSRDRGDDRRSSREPAGIVLEGFESFTRHLSAAFSGAGGLGGGDPAGGRPLDSDVAGVFEKRLVRFEPAQLAALSSEEAQVGGWEGGREGGRQTEREREREREMER